MAHGLPDYYRGVDIAYQALAELIIRPKYGAAQSAQSAIAVTANDETDIVSVSGKGMLYGGCLLLDHTSTQKDSYPHLYVDGEKLTAGTFDGLNHYNLKVAYSYALYVLLYDDTAFAYCVGVTPYITFESSFKIAYQEEHGSTPTVTARAIYALI